MAMLCTATALSSPPHSSRGYPRDLMKSQHVQASPAKQGKAPTSGVAEGQYTRRRTCATMIITRGSHQISQNPGTAYRTSRCATSSSATGAEHQTVKSTLTLLETQYSVQAVPLLVKGELPRLTGRGYILTPSLGQEKGKRRGSRAQSVPRPSRKCWHGMAWGPHGASHVGCDVQGGEMHQRKATNPNIGVQHQTASGENVSGPQWVVGSNTPATGCSVGELGHLGHGGTNSQVTSTRAGQASQHRRRPHVTADSLPCSR